MSTTVKQEIWEWVKSIAIALILALVLRTYVIEHFLVEGESMLPTLQNNEHLLVYKLGARFAPPKRGQIIVFKFPGDPRKDFVKRVIGLPGDTVEITGGKVLVNGEVLREPYILEEPFNDFPKTQVPPGTVFVLGDNRNNSMDSRYPAVGFVPFSNIKGQAVFVIWPLNHFGPIRSVKQVMP